MSDLKNGCSGGDGCNSTIQEHYPVQIISTHPLVCSFWGCQAWRQLSLWVCAEWLSTLILFFFQSSYECVVGTNNGNGQLEIVNGQPPTLCCECAFYYFKAWQTFLLEFITSGRIKSGNLQQGQLQGGRRKERRAFGRGLPYPARDRLKSMSMSVVWYIMQCIQTENSAPEVEF